MSMYKLVTGLVGLLLAGAVAMVLMGGGSEVKAQLAPVVTPDNRADAGPVNWGCAQEPWPFGCQWRERPVRRIIIRGPRPV
jgi:hypothetical protein